MTKTVINHRFKSEIPFQEISYMIDVWINKGSGWIVESIESQSINISTYRPLAGSSYMNLPVQLKSRRKGLINIKNKDQKYFLYCHVRHINPSKEHQDSMDSLLLNHDDKRHYVSIKDFDRFMFHKTRNKNKKWFCKSCLQCFSSENVLIIHKEDCLSINGKQSVKLEEGIIEFENYSKQIPVPFTIYADFVCNLKGVESYEGSYSRNIKITFLVVLLTKFFALMAGLQTQLLFIEVKMLHMDLLKHFLKSISTEKK